MEKLWGRMLVTVAQQRECTDATGHLKVGHVLSLMLYVFYHIFLKVKGEGKKKRNRANQSPFCLQGKAGPCLEKLGQLLPVRGVQSQMLTLKQQ